MVQSWSSRPAVARVLALVALCAVLSCGLRTARAAIDFTADPTLPDPVDTALFTHNPFLVTTAQRNLATTAQQGHRNLRQTFQLASDINVGQIIFSLDVQAPTDGLQMRIYEVADVQAAWNPGTLVHQFAFPQLIGTNQWLGISFTGGNVFGLPARATGTQGYGIEFSDNIGIVGANLGALTYNNDGTDYYTGGRYYSEGASFETRDIGLIIIASTETPCDPGDVNCDMTVDGVDLGLIAANFRKNGDRSLGDLTGDGIIDFDDFGQWKSNYAGPPLGASAFAFLTVPEPASLVLLLAATAMLPLRKRKTASARRGFQAAG